MMKWIFDARGNGTGGVSPTITGDHQDRITDYTAIVVEDEDMADTGESPWGLKIEDSGR